MKKFIIDTFLSILSIGYPILYLLHWQGSDFFSFWLYAMIAMWGLKAIFSPLKNTKIFALLMITLLCIVILNQKLELMYFYPIAINSIMLIIFASSLFQNQSFVEKIARLSNPDLPDEGVIYTRRVTQAWVVFFSLNILVSLILIQLKAFNLWAIYNGFISYILMGALFIIEYIIRQRVIKNNV